MSMSVYASSNALSYMQQPLQQGFAGASDSANSFDPLTSLMNAMSQSDGSSDRNGGASNSTSNAFDFPALPLSGSAMAMLISMQGQQASSLAGQSGSQMSSDVTNDVFANICKAGFENALAGAGVSKSAADTLFASLDAKSGDGSAAKANPLDAMLSDAGATGATTQTTTNADGSITTTISYADGTKIDMTAPAVASATSGGGKVNLLETLIRLQSQLLPAAGSSASSIA
jgi:hypothetical protein